MSDSTQQYILARPIEAKKLDGGNVLMIFPGSDLKSFVNENLFEADFVPLDIPAIQKQLEQIIHERLQWCEHCNDQIDEPELGNVDDLTKMAVKEVLVLFGLENKETEQ